MSPVENRGDDRPELVTLRAFAALSAWQNRSRFAASPWVRPDGGSRLPHLGRARWLPKVLYRKADFSAFTPKLKKLLEASRPPNWPETARLDQVLQVVRDDGLPLVWVPRRSLVEGLLVAEDRDARIAILLAHVQDLVDDCRDVLTEVTHPALAGLRHLAERNIDALEQGHYEAAQALAVVVTDTAVSRCFGRPYDQVKRLVGADPSRLPFTQLRIRTAFVPIYRFFTEWSPRSPRQPPEAISRHVTVHNADPGHYTEGNALVACLLACSILRALQDMQEVIGAGNERGRRA